VVAAWPAMLRIRFSSHEYANLVLGQAGGPAPSLGVLVHDEIQRHEGDLFDGHQDGRGLREPDRVRRAGPRRFL